MNLTDTFVDTLYTLKENRIPDDALFMARECLLEETGLMLAGASFQQERLTAYLDNFTGEDATVLGLGRKASLQNAAFANGISGHSFDFDDGHRFSTVHLASTVIPPVLAAAEKKKLGMKEILRGIVIGYETGIRLGQCVQPAHRARGFHSSGTVGAVAAAAGVAALLDFDRDTMKNTMAAAFSSAAGINEMMENVSTMKPFNIGRACHDGITAAFTAAAGFRGPYDPILGTFGYLHGACETYNEEILKLACREDLSAEYHITGGYHKPYACCRHTHGAVYAVLQAASQAGLRMDQIEKVDIKMYGQGVKGHTHTAVPSATAAKMSTPFCIALALKTGRIGIDSFSEENLRDGEILAFSEKVRIEPDEEMTAMVPGKRASAAFITAKDGRRFSFRADYAAGEPELPMTTEDFRQKFRSLLRTLNYTEGSIAGLADLILTGSPDARELIARLSVRDGSSEHIS